MNKTVLLIVFFGMVVLSIYIGMHDFEVSKNIEKSRQELFEMLELPVVHGKELDPNEVKRILAQIKDNQPILPFLGTTDQELNNIVCERIELTIKEIQVRGDRITAQDLGEIGSLFKCSAYKK